MAVHFVISVVASSTTKKLDTLKTACESFMVKQVHPGNCIEFDKLAELYHLDKVQENAKRMMRSEFKMVASTDGFKELSCGELIQLIKDDDVTVASEDVVFDAVLTWVRHDLGNRKSSFEAILEHVRIPFCTSNYLQYLKDAYDLLTPKCFEYLHEAVAFQAASVHQHETSSCRTTPRKNFRMKSCLVVVGAQKGVVTSGGNPMYYYFCQYYEEDTSCWKSLTTLPESFGFADSVCYTDRGVVVTGGKKAYDQCLLFDMATKKWEAMPPLTTIRHCHRSVSLGDCIYVMGGFSVDVTVLASVECLHQKSPQWSRLPDMRHAVFAPMVTTYRKKIFVFGGRDIRDQHLCYAQVFDTTQNKWSTLSDMPVACRNGTAVTMNDFIYVVGGWSRTCLRYQPASDVWTTLSQPQHEHAFAPAVVWRGSILLTAGNYDEQKPWATEQFDPLTNTWSNSNIAQLEEKLDYQYMFKVDLYGKLTA